MSDVISTKQVGNLRLTIMRDDDAESPRTAWDNVGVFWSEGMHRRYNFHEEEAGDVLQRIIEATIKQGMMLPPSMTLSAMEQEWTNHEWADWLCRWQKEYPELYAMVPVHLYEHSGRSFSVGGFSDSWDSGLIGWLMVDRERWDDQHGGEWSQEEAQRVLTGEVEDLDNYHCYGVQGYRIDRVTECECCGTEKVEELESCWGFYERYQNEATDNRPKGWQAVLDMRDNVSADYEELFND